MKNKRLGKQKGRLLDAEALIEVQKLLTNMPRRKDMLIEALHLIQDKYHFLSAKHVVALAHEMKLAQAEAVSYTHHRAHETDA